VHAVTIRRLIVFGVCALGVTALYVAPAAVRSPQPSTAPRPHEEPATSASVSATTSAGGTTVPRSGGPTTATRDSGSTTAPVPDRTQDAATERPAPRSSPERGATAFDPDSTEDAEPPARVVAVTSAAVTPDKLTLRWPAASDNVGVTTYRVLLNGYEVASTPVTHATVRWFNDDASEHVVQVRALDAAGNQSVVSPALLVARPTPGPDPTTSPEPTTDPEPTTSPSPEPTPDASSQAPSGAGSPDSAPDQGEEPPMTVQNAPLHPSAPAATGR
jgi:hypothetical protein